MNWSSVLNLAKAGRPIRREAWEPIRKYTYGIDNGDAYMIDQDGERIEAIDLDDLDAGDWIALGGEVTFNPAPQFVVGASSGSVAVYTEGIKDDGEIDTVTLTYQRSVAPVLNITYYVPPDPPTEPEGPEEPPIEE